MEKNNKKIINSALIGILILIISLGGCIESDEEGYKPIIEETNETAKEPGEPNESNTDAADISSDNLTDKSNITNITNEAPETETNISKNLTEQEPDPKSDYLFSCGDVPGKMGADPRDEVR